MDAALDILGITGPIYLAIALGYLATRMGVFAAADLRTLGTFTLRIALPALLFNALSQRSLGEILNGHYLAAYALTSLTLVGGSVLWARRVQGRSASASSMIAMGMCCPNSGFVGYPVMLLLLGPSVAGVSLALNMLVENLLIIPLLLALADSGGPPGGIGTSQAPSRAAAWRRALAQSLAGLARNPMIWGIAAGVAVAFSGLHLPAPVSRTVTLFANASGALSLFVIGGALVGLNTEAGLRSTVAQIAVGKLLIHPLLMAAVLSGLIPIADPALRAAALLTCALPIMGVYTLFSQRHGHGAPSAAALLVTTVASFVTLSALIWMLGVWGWVGA